MNLVICSLYLEKLWIRMILVNSITDWNITYSRQCRLSHFGFFLMYLFCCGFKGLTKSPCMPENIFSLYYIPSSGLSQFIKVCTCLLSTFSMRETENMGKWAMDTAASNMVARKSRGLQSNPQNPHKKAGAEVWIEGSRLELGGSLELAGQSSWTGELHIQ